MLHTLFVLRSILIKMHSFIVVATIHDQKLYMGEIRFFVVV